VKLHVLNAAHSALAYLGLARGHTYVRDAIADPVLGTFLDGLVEEEIAPALPDLPVRTYWKSSGARFANVMVDHRLDQIAQDGAFKLAERIHPLMLANVREGRPVHRLGAIIKAWLDRERTLSGGRVDASINNPALFSEQFRADPRLRAAIEAAP
jgi:fructuronate reductase